MPSEQKGQLCKGEVAGMSTGCLKNHLLWVRRGEGCRGGHVESCGHGSYFNFILSGMGSHWKVLNRPSDTI